MAGLPEYIGMGAAVAGVYIMVKYGPQIVHNLQSNQANPQSQLQTPDQTPSAPGSQTPADQIPNLTYAPETAGTPTRVIRAVQHNPRPEPRHINPVTGDETLDIPGHPNDTGTYQPPHPAAIRPPVPSGSHPETGTHPITHKYPHTHGRHAGATAGCFCNATTTVSSGDLTGTWEGTCSLKGQPCTVPHASSYLGYFDGYEIPTVGPQWRKTIPYRSVVASQGMALRQGRVSRALAAGNHDFMPAGFVLSESSVRRGFNNVYSAGT